MKWLSDWLARVFRVSPDPAHNCPIYRDCAHVDGPLCNVPTCSDRLEAIAKDTQAATRAKGPQMNATQQVLSDEETLNKLIRLAGRRDVIHSQFQGRPMSNETYDAYADLRDVQIPELKRAILAKLQASPQAQAEGAQPPGKWEGAEEWMPLAWELCADECGEDACTELVWEGGPIPEPWGDRWLKYEDEAKRLIALVRKHVPSVQAQAGQAAQEPWTLDDEGRAIIVNSHHYTPESVKAIVDRLKDFADPERSTQADWENLDWRNWCNVLWRVITGLAHDVPLQQAAQGAGEVGGKSEFCWLVELFMGDGTGNSLGFYHTGFTDLSGNSRSTKDPLKAKRYDTWKEANAASVNLGHTLQGTWRAVQHGFTTHAPAPVVAGPDEHAVALMAALAKRCYAMSESHLSGARLIVGFERLDDASDAHMAIAGSPRTAPVALPMTEEHAVLCLVKAGCIGTVKMSYDTGPYGITRTSINADKLIRAVEAHHGITTQAGEKGAV